ncbi:MAG: exo-rhamnogalacturonan lyase family protein, partial [Planctomycetota bacterium]
MKKSGVIAVLLFCILCFSVFANNKISLQILEPKERGAVLKEFPVSVGLIFPEGELQKTSLGSLVDENNTKVPCEIEITGWWDKEKKNVKWLLLHFFASTDKKYFFVKKEKNASFGGKSLAKQETGAIHVDTGPLKIHFKNNSTSLFEKIIYNSKGVIKESKEIKLTIANKREKIATEVQPFKTVIEKNTSYGATVKADTFLKLSGKENPIAKISMRVKLYKGKSYFKIYHTMTWMSSDIEIAVNDFSFTLEPLVKPGKAVIGLDDYSDKRFTAEFSAADKLDIIQDTGEHFYIKKGDNTLQEGKHLGGYLNIESAEGPGISISLKHAWQRYQSGFVLDKGKLKTCFWPDAGTPLSFKVKDIMGDAIFYNKGWLNVRNTWGNKFAKKKYLDPVDRKKQEFFDYYQYRHKFQPTAEGAAFTHEMTISFHNNTSSEKPYILNSVNQHPLVLRQGPKHAMQILHMGFNMLPSDPEKYPNIERALHNLGKLSLARWVKENNFGLLRFGMVRWFKHTQETYYRWMDNAQYDQQLIPWLLYIRGGDRSFFEEGEITARLLMDSGTNHYNSRGVPTGYMAGARHHIPFPRAGHSPQEMKFQKVHYLSYYYHLTGYERAKEVMTEVIEGAKKYSQKVLEEEEKKNPGQEYYDLVMGGGRDSYNMNVFWVNAWEETFDPEVEKFMNHNMLATLRKKYNKERNSFAGPPPYLYNGLVLLYRITKNKEITDTMLKHLRIDSIDKYGGIQHQGPIWSIGYQVAHEVTGDNRYAKAGWEISSRLADLVTDLDLKGELPPKYSLYYNGNMLYRFNILPILSGMALGVQSKLNKSTANVFKDVFFHIQPVEGQKNKFIGNSFIRPHKTGRLDIKILQKYAKKGATVRIFKHGAKKPLKEQVFEAGKDFILGELSLDKVDSKDTIRVEV